MKPPARPATFAGRTLRADVIPDELALAALPTAVGLTRLFIGTYLRKWRLDAVTGTAGLVASEIVTNPIKATGLTERPPTTRNCTTPMSAGSSPGCAGRAPEWLSKPGTVTAGPRFCPHRSTWTKAAEGCC